MLLFLFGLAIMIAFIVIYFSPLIFISNVKPIYCLSYFFCFICTLLIITFILYGIFGGVNNILTYGQKSLFQKNYLNYIDNHTKTIDIVISNFHEYLKNNSSDSEGWYLLSKIYRSQNNLIAANNALEKAIALNRYHST